jgi:hypothetical protein
VRQATLAQLNRDTFEAEVKKKVDTNDSVFFFRKVLAHEFIIGRSNHTLPNQVKEWILI